MFYNRALRLLYSKLTMNSKGTEKVYIPTRAVDLQKYVAKVIKNTNVYLTSIEKQQFVWAMKIPCLLTVAGTEAPADHLTDFLDWDTCFRPTCLATFKVKKKNKKQTKTKKPSKFTACMFPIKEVNVSAHLHWTASRSLLRINIYSCPNTVN